MTMTEAEAKAWVGGPLVKHVRQHYNPADTLELLEGVSLVCNELETRFPGLPFRTILSETDAMDPWPTLRALARNPLVAPADIALIIPEPPQDATDNTRIKMQSIRLRGHSLEELQEIHPLHVARKMHDAWCRAQDPSTLVDMPYMSAERRRNMILDSQPQFDRIVRYMIVDEFSLSEVEEACDVSRNTISKALLGYRYLYWLATQS